MNVISNIRGTKWQNLYESHLSCSCIFPIHWNPLLSRELRCSWSSTDNRCSNYIWVMNKFIVCWSAFLSLGLNGLIWCIACVEYIYSHSFGSLDSHRYLLVGDFNYRAWLYLTNWYRMFVTFGIWFKQHFDTRYLVFCNLSPPRMFCPWTFFQSIGFNMVPSDALMSHLATELGYSAGEFQAVQLIVLVAFGVVD